MKSEEMSLWIAVSPKCEPFKILNMHVTHSTAELFQKRKYLKKTGCHYPLQNLVHQFIYLKGERDK